MEDLKSNSSVVRNDTASENVDPSSLRWPRKRKQCVTQAPMG